jgi:flagellar motility protein MotE (MotC chaperone)
MMRFVRDIRLLPVVLFAAVCLLTLKVIGIVHDGGYTLADPPDAVSATQGGPDGAEQNLVARNEQNHSWAGEIFNFPGGGSSAGLPKPPQEVAPPMTRDGFLDITGSVGKAKPAPKPAGGSDKKASAAGPLDPPHDPGGTVVDIDTKRSSSAAERAILEHLQERRQQIEAHAREVDIRDGLVKAAEKRLEVRLAELKNLEAQVKTSMQDRKDADAKRFRALVAIYENMKPQDAAKIFDRLDLDVLVQVTSQIKPRQMSEILGQMAPAAAERLTVELAKRATPGDNKTPIAAELPKIQGQPGG